MAVGDFPMDPTINRNANGTTGGLPPAGHVRRCQAYTRNKEQCQQWALKESHYCKFHGGAKRSGSRMTDRKMGASFYRKKVSVGLSELLEELENAPPDERRSLVMELDMARVTASKAVELFDMVFFTEQGKANASEQLKMQVMGQVQRSLDMVSKVAVNLAKAEALAPDKISAMQVDFVINGVTRILKKYLEGDERFIKILDEISEIKVPRTDSVSATIVID